MTNLLNRSVAAIGLLMYSAYTVAAAPITTTIVFDGSTGSGNQNVAVADDTGTGVYTIDSLDGTASGTNLFHSFSDFNIANGETARFTDSNNAALSQANFDNVIVRVTGGNESAIYGNLESDASLGQADFFLLNPSGILFGEGASVNISGSFYASTADRLVFDSTQNQFMSTGSTGSTFYTAPVEAFGFMNPNPAAITVTDASLKVDDGNKIALVAGDISLSGGEFDSSTFDTKPTLAARNGEVHLATAVGGVNIPLNISTYRAENAVGAINLSNAAAIDTSGDSGGRVVIRGGSLSLDRSSITNNIASQSSATQQQAGIDIETVAEVTLSNLAKIAANSVETASSRSDGISIVAGDLSLHSFSTIESTMGTATGVMDQSNYQEGLININVENSINIDGRSKISSVNSGIGKAATIDLSANAINISDGGMIDTSANLFNAFGQGGDILVNTTSLEITGDSNFAPNPVFLTGLQSNGAFLALTNSGNITVNAQNIKVSDNGGIRANNYSDSPGGNIALNADGGSIEILTGGRVRIDGNGSAGNINLSADSIILSGVAINELTDDIQSARIENRSSSSSSTSGNINIESQSFSMTDGAQIITRTAQNQAGGNVAIAATEITISGFNQDIYDYEKNQPGVTLSEALHNAATRIDVESSGDTVDGGTTQAGPGSHISLSGNIIDISDFAIVSTGTFGLAENAGNIDIRADTISIRENSIVKSFQDSSYGTNQPTGNINIEAKNFLLIDQSTITTEVHSTNSSGGNIMVSSDKLYFSAATLDTSANTGNGGDILVRSKQSLITSDTVFNAHSENSIDGTIEIQTNWKENSGLSNSVSQQTEAPLLNISACELNKITDASTLLIRQASRQNSSHYPDDRLIRYAFIPLENKDKLTPITMAQNIHTGCDSDKSLSKYVHR